MGSAPFATRIARGVRRVMVGGKVMLEAAERQELKRRVRAMTFAVRDRQRAEIILPRG
jgi:hypothetical protein